MLATPCCAEWRSACPDRGRPAAVGVSQGWLRLFTPLWRHRFAWSDALPTRVCH
jgi:hypothetical protein